MGRYIPDISSVGLRHEPQVRLRRCINSMMKVRAGESHNSVIKSNCVAVRRGGEQPPCVRLLVPIAASTNYYLLVQNQNKLSLAIAKLMVSGCSHTIYLKIKKIKGVRLH